MNSPNQESKLGTFSTLSIGIGGMVGGGIFAVTGLTIEVTKGGAPIAFLIAGIAALSTAIALIVLCVKVDENPATRYHLWILVGMIVVSLTIEIVFRGITGRKMRLVEETTEPVAESEGVRK